MLFFIFLVGFFIAILLSKVFIILSSELFSALLGKYLNSHIKVGLWELFLLIFLVLGDCFNINFSILRAASGVMTVTHV
jgi:hypothetical protein